MKFSEFPAILRRGAHTAWFFLRGVALAALVGLICGGVSTAFYYAFHWATGLRTAHPWLLFLLPAAGVAIALLYRLCGMERDGGTNLVLTSVRETPGLALRTAPLVFVSTILTHLTGGSSGREGAILQIGGSLSSSLGRLLRLDHNGMRVITLCGMSAAFAALFGTPLTAAVFAMEVVTVGTMYYSGIVGCVVSALVGFQVAQFFGVPATSFVLTDIPALSALNLARALGMGVLLALLSLLFCAVMHTAHRLYDRFLTDHILRAVVGGALVIALTFLVWLWNPGTYDYNGAGEGVIRAAMGGTARPEAFLLKMLFTAVTLGAGFKGGEIVPVFFTGATFGCVAAPLLGLPASFGAALGLVGLFCGVTNCPLASLLLALELFGGSLELSSLGLFAAVIAVSYMLSGYSGLYSGQKIKYGKLHPEKVNRKSGNP